MFDLVLGINGCSTSVFDSLVLQGISPLKSPFYSYFLVIYSHGH